jgi:uncharacterized membrane protein YphA (DoxX/SURF4 family)
METKQWINIILMIVVDVVLGAFIAMALVPMWAIPEPTVLIPNITLIMAVPLVGGALLLTPTLFFLNQAFPDKFPLLSLMLPLRLILGYEFLHGGLEKVLDTTYYAGTYLFTNTIANHPSVYAQTFMAFLYTNPTLWLAVIAWGEVLIGLSFVPGFFTRLGSLGGAMMQLVFAFLLGYLSPSTFGLNVVGPIAFFVVGMYHGGRYLGVDQYIGPWLENSKSSILKFFGWWT